MSRAQWAQPPAVVGLAALAILSLSACDPEGFGPAPVDAGSEPNASALARPVVTTIAETRDGGVDAGPLSLADGGLADGGKVPLPAPEPYRADEALPLEATRQKEANGVALDGRWLLVGLQGAPSGVARDAKALAALKQSLGRRWQLQLTRAGRMRIDFDSRGFPMLQGTALLARRSRYGHVLLWPQSRGYRVMPPGTLRTAFSELRADVTPLLSPAIQPLPDGERLGLITRRLQLRSGYGQLVLEQAELSESGQGAALLCRTLLEIAGIAPSAEVCLRDLVSVSAEYSWGGAADGAPALRFEVTELRKQLQGGASPFVMVPAGLLRINSGLPADRRPLSSSELRGLRSADEPSADEPTLKTTVTTAYNGSDQLMWLYLDGLPTLAVAPWHTVALPVLRPGRYRVQWRSYLGDVLSEGEEQTLPALLRFGAEPVKEKEEPDAGG